MSTADRPSPSLVGSPVADLEQTPRPGSRAARLAQPRTLDVLVTLAKQYGVCVRPVPMRRTDLASGRTEVIDLPCGNTRESKCSGCAKRAQRLRERQCREGWHRDDEPLPPPQASPEQVGLILLRADFEYARAACLAESRFDQIAELDEAIEEVEQLIAASGLRGPAAPTNNYDEDQDDGDGPRRVRSTRRRQDAPDLPRKRVRARTVGTTFTGHDGKVFRPSMFVTFTLPSYGRVRPDGSPVHPDSYDYRRAAWDAVHLPALLDRFWQNLRRVEGWNIQYFGSVEPQRRLAPHAHFAIRGAIPRATLKLVASATYHQVWWPSTATVHYAEHEPQPVWDERAPVTDPDSGEVIRHGGYVDPATRIPLPTWAQALDELDAQLADDPDRWPEHVVRFGTQLDIKGVLAGTPDADKSIRYLCKYISKSVAECHQPETPGAEAHLRRLWEQLRVTPCSPRCSNWLCYGIQPKNARSGMVAGRCRGRVHQHDTLGIGGRRILVSRQWSGKTLADHRYDQAAWVRQVLAAGTGHATPVAGDLERQIDDARAGGAPAPIAWERARPTDPDVPDLRRRLLRAISTRIQHRAALAAAKARSPPSAGDVSATADGEGGEQ